MRAVMIEPPEHLLAERRRLGLDRWDEVWDGVLHMPPMPAFAHQRLGTKLLAVLGPFAEKRGWEIAYEVGLYRRDNDYRGPDIAIAKPSDVSERGLEGHAELVIEILSPEDESRDKLPFYAQCHVPEVWLIEPKTRVIEVYVLRGETYFAVADQHGVVHAPLLELTLETIEGPKLQISWDGGAAEI